MNPALLLGATGAKLSSVAPVGTIIMTVGAVLGLAGWIWLVYQNGRFGVVHGVMSLILPPYALVYAFVGLEHRQKSAFTAAFLGGTIIAAMGYSLVYAAADCENQPDCGIRRDYTNDAENGAPVKGDEGDAAEETGESSVLFLEECGLSA